MLAPRKRRASLINRDLNATDQDNECDGLTIYGNVGRIAIDETDVTPAHEPNVYCGPAMKVRSNT